MRRLQGLLLLLAAISVTACMPFGARSQARVSEIETTTRFSGSSSTVRTEIDYLADGRLDEMTRTASGDFLERWELSYDKAERVEEVAVISDSTTYIVELTYTGELMTEATLRHGESDTDIRWDVSYFNGDRRFIESVVTTVDTVNSFSETASKYAYDDASRIKGIVTSMFSEYEGSTNTSESKSDTALRYDVDTGALERVTTTTEVPYTPPAVTDWCWEGGYYDDGYCDTGCPQVDPDCGGGNTVVPPGGGETEIVTSTVLYSVKYNDKGRLDEVDGPDGESYSVDYDAEGRIDEVEVRNDGYSVITEYTYDEGAVKGHSFSPAVPSGEFFDVEGSSFGTLDFQNPMKILGGVTASAGSSDG